jgi:DNA polymerase-3 subunit beta
MPILENILVGLEGSTLTLTGTDLAVSLTVSLTVQGVEDGTIAIPAKRLMDTVRALPDVAATFQIDTTANKITIVTENGQYSMNGESAREYPQISDIAGKAQATLDSASLKKLVHQTVFAVSTDELRPAMMGVLLQAVGTDLRAVATDGHRLVRFTRKSENPVTLANDIVVPAKALQLVGKSIESGECTIALSETHVKFSFDNTALISRLIEERYPNYESVIPQENDKVMVVDRDALVQAIRRVSLYASATTHQIRFDLGAGTVQLAAQDMDFGGEATESLPCTYDGAALAIGFNSQYLIDILTHLESAQVEFKLSAPTRAGIVAPSPKGNTEDVLMLVMPVRLNA